MNLDKLVYSLSIVAIGLIGYYILRTIIEISRNNALKKSLINRVSNTYILLLQKSLKYIFLIIVIVGVLQINGVDISSMLTGLGIASIIIGLAVQDALKDIIRGLSIIGEGYFAIGDVIKYEDNIGIVTDLGLKSTKIKDLNSDNIVSIANRNIEKVEVVSSTINLNIPFPIDTKMKVAQRVLNEIVESLKTIEKVDDTEYRGVQDINTNSIIHRVYLSCKPKHTIKIRREALTKIICIFEKNQIKVPYQQLDIHSK